jgi:hypothetical protein
MNGTAEQRIDVTADDGTAEGRNSRRQKSRRTEQQNDGIAERENIEPSH